MIWIIVFLVIIFGIPLAYILLLTVIEFSVLIIFGYIIPYKKFRNLTPYSYQEHVSRERNLIKSLGVLQYFRYRKYSKKELSDYQKKLDKYWESKFQDPDE